MTCFMDFIQLLSFFISWILTRNAVRQLGPLQTIRAFDFIILLIIWSMKARWTGKWRCLACSLWRKFIFDNWSNFFCHSTTWLKNDNAQTFCYICECIIWYWKWNVTTATFSQNLTWRKLAKLSIIFHGLLQCFDVSTSSGDWWCFHFFVTPNITLLLTFLYIGHSPILVNILPGYSAVFCIKWKFLFFLAHGVQNTLINGVKNDAVSNCTWQWNIRQHDIPGRPCKQIQLKFGE